MGVLRLFQLIKSLCPEAIREIDISEYKNKKVAIDSYLTIYQYLIATKSIKGDSIREYKDKDGNLTAHLIGILNRSVNLMQKGIRPCWVFDGCPPHEKEDMLMERFKRNIDAKNNLSVALSSGDTERALKMASRSTVITNTMLEDAKTVIKLLGLPCIDAPGESEAQCAAFDKAGIVSAVCSEDLDTLVFGGSKLLRGFQNTEAPCIEMRLEIVLEKLNISYLQFIDICILSGCDYSKGIKGIGIFKACELIKEYSNIEGVINYLKRSSSNLLDDHSFNDFFFNYEKARKLFEDPDVINPNEIVLNWGIPDFNALHNFLCVEKGFNKDKIDSLATKLNHYNLFIANENIKNKQIYPRKRKNEDIFESPKLNSKKKKLN